MTGPEVEADCGAGAGALVGASPLVTDDALLCPLLVTSPELAGAFSEGLHAPNISMTIRAEAIDNSASRQPVRPAIGIGVITGNEDVAKVSLRHFIILLGWGEVIAFEFCCARRFDAARAREDWLSRDTGATEREDGR